MQVPGSCLNRAPPTSLHQNGMRYAYGAVISPHLCWTLPDSRFSRLGTITMANSIPSPSARRRPSYTAAVFNLSPSSSSSASDTDNDDSPLPFPAALPRSDFLAPDFQPAAYLSSLPHRHQTLEDLRSDLRDRSATISAELLDLVNTNYSAFLSLGTELKGGNEKVEDIKVALLGFRRAVEDVQSKVTQRRDEAQSLTDELMGVRRAIDAGRKMCEVSERLSLLEDRLALENVGATGGQPFAAVSDSEGGEEDDDEEEVCSNADGPGGSSPAKLSTLAQDCRQIMTLLSRLDHEHPFVIRMQERLARCRDMLLLDLNNALKEARRAGAKDHGRILTYLGIYRMLDAQKEAVQAVGGR